MKSYEEQRKQAQIGIWYAIWYDNKPAGSFWETSGRNNKTYPGDPIYYRPLLPDGTYGKYDSRDRDVLNFNLKEIADAQIDFIIMDQTNMIDNENGRLNAASIITAEAIAAWNKVEGNRKIQYCSAIGAFARRNTMDHVEEEAKKLVERYLDVEDLGAPENHVYVDGKPLMVIFNCVFSEAEWNEYQATHDTPYCDRFTIRYSKGHVKKGEMGLWGWCMQDGPQINEDVAVMMPGWYKIARPGEPYGTLPWHPYAFRERGKFYEDGWKLLLQSDIVPNYVVINSFNEYAEHTGVYTAKTDLFPEDYGIERWLDGDGKENPSMYWDMTRAYIAKFKNGDRT